MNKNKQRRPIHLTPNQRFGIRLLGKKLNQTEREGDGFGSTG